MVCLVDFGKVALTEQITEVEDVVLDLLAGDLRATWLVAHQRLSLNY